MGEECDKNIQIYNFTSTNNVFILQRPMWMLQRVQVTLHSPMLVRMDTLM